MDISALLKILENNSITKDDFFSVFSKTSEKDPSLDESIFSQEYSDVEITNLFDSFDVNGDGVINQDDNLEELVENFLSEDLMNDEDLTLLLNNLDDLYTETELDNIESIEDAPVDTTPDSVETIVLPKQISYHKKSNGTKSTPKNADTSKVNYSSMSVEELQSKLSESQSQLSLNQDNLNSIINGSHPALQSLQEGIDSAKEEFQTKLNVVAPELAGKYEEAKQTLDDHNKNIAEQNVNINNKQSEVDTLTSAIASMDSQISAYDNAISNLKSKLGSENAPDDLSSKIADAESKRTALIQQKAEKEQALQQTQSDLADLKEGLSSLEAQASEKETALTTIEQQISELNNSELNTLKSELDTAESNFVQQQNALKTEAEKSIQSSQAEVNEIQSALDVKEAQQIKRDNAVFNTEDAKELYDLMGLEEQGLNFDVFSLAMEGYNNLEDKGNGYLGIFDTTQNDDAERYYLLDMNNFELLGRSQLKTGSGNMDNIESSNRDGSHATLSGFEIVSEQYYSSSMGKYAMRIDGLEEGINDNARSKGTVVHYTTGNHTWGCKGFDPVYTNGHLDLDATYEKMATLFPTGTILFTNPTDDRYRELSELV